MTTGVTFDSDPDVLLGGSGSDDISDHHASSEFNAKFGKPAESPATEDKNFGYKVVGRLSRWEGGNSTPYQQGKLEAGADANLEDVEPEKITFREFVKQFFKPSYDLTEVTIEDIERVKLMHDRFIGDAQFNFNYSTLLLIASVIAAVGLGSDSTASVIASMLVSPLMGPVTAISYGISIGDYKMVRMGAVTEVVSLLACILVGSITVAFMLPFDVSDEWPSKNMTDRGTLENFWCGIPIAFFSGLGVAVGLLDSQTNSLVGVAISASLLPPAVNAGMLWVIAAHDDYRTEEGHNYAVQGTISLGLTVMNIVVIIIASMIMFRLKETLPIEKSIFWSDLGVARKIYHNVAIFPKIQQAPDDKEIKKRVSKFFPRASAMPMTFDLNSSGVSFDSPKNSSRKNTAWHNSTIPWDNTLSLSGNGAGTAGEHLVEAVRGPNDDLDIMKSITEEKPMGKPNFVHDAGR